MRYLRFILSGILIGTTITSSAPDSLLNSPHSDWQTEALAPRGVASWSSHWRRAPEGIFFWSLTSPRKVFWEELSLRLLRTSPDPRVLDLGTGRMPVPTIMALAAETVHRSVRIVGIDLSPELARQRRPANSHYVPAQIQALPFVSESFDAATSANGLEYVDHLFPALREIYRVLKPQALVYLWVHEQSGIYGQHFLPQALFWHTMRSHFSFSHVRQDIEAGVPLERVKGRALAQFYYAAGHTSPSALEESEVWRTLYDHLENAETLLEAQTALTHLEQETHRLLELYSHRFYVGQLFRAAHRTAWIDILSQLGFSVLQFTTDYINGQHHYGWKIQLQRHKDAPSPDQLTQAHRQIEQLQHFASAREKDHIDANKPFGEFPEQGLHIHGPEHWVRHLSAAIQAQVAYQETVNAFENLGLRGRVEASYAFNIRINRKDQSVVISIPVTASSPLRYLIVAVRAVSRYMEQKDAPLLMAYGDDLLELTSVILGLFQQEQAQMLIAIQTHLNRPGIQMTDILAAEAVLNPATDGPGLRINLFVRDEPHAMIFQRSQKMRLITGDNRQRLDSLQRMEVFLDYTRACADLRLLEPLVSGTFWPAMEHFWLDVGKHWGLWLGEVFLRLNSLGGSNPDQQEKQLLTAEIAKLRHENEPYQTALQQMWKSVSTADSRLPLTRRIAPAYASFLFSEEDILNDPLIEESIRIPENPELLRYPSIDLFSGPGLRFRLRHPSHLTPDIAVDQNGFVAAILTEYSRMADVALTVRVSSAFDLQQTMPEPFYRLITLWNPFYYTAGVDADILFAWVEHLLKKVPDGGVFWFSTRAKRQDLSVETWAADDQLFQTVHDLVQSQSGLWKSKKVHTTTGPEKFHHHYILVRKSS